ncbi:MAG: hypothetical protein EKK55_21840 [Rhodocyclaceae bacterium]|nr:MAG: hypothetical protein EKK55_21840 [Rhodocyclaceae bacterium]
MYLQGYEYDPGLGSLRKKLKKLGKVAAHVGAAVATGGASLAVSAAMINAKKQAKAQAAAAEAAAAQERALMAQINAPAVAPSIAPTTTMAPSIKTGGDIAPAPSSFIQREAEPAPMTMPAGQPAWLMPALLIGGGMMVAMMVSRGRQ